MDMLLSHADPCPGSWRTVTSPLVYPLCSTTLIVPPPSPSSRQFDKQPTSLPLPDEGPRVHVCKSTSSSSPASRPLPRPGLHRTRRPAPREPPAQGLSQPGPVPSADSGALSGWLPWCLGHLFFPLGSREMSHRLRLTRIHHHPCPEPRPVRFFLFFFGWPPPHPLLPRACVPCAWSPHPSPGAVAAGQPLAGPVLLLLPSLRSPPHASQQR